MILATLATKTGRSGPHGRRALAFLDLGVIIAGVVILFEPLMQLIYVTQPSIITTILVLALYVSPFAVMAGLALRALLKKDD